MFGPDRVLNYWMIFYLCFQNFFLPQRANQTRQEEKQLMNNALNVVNCPSGIWYLIYSDLALPPPSNYHFPWYIPQLQRLQQNFSHSFNMGKTVGSIFRHCVTSKKTKTNLDLSLNKNVIKGNSSIIVFVPVVFCYLYSGIQIIATINRASVHRVLYRQRVLKK